MKRLLTFLVLIIISKQLVISQPNTPPLPNGETIIGGHLHAGAGNEVWSDYSSLYFNYRGNAAATYFWNLGGSNGTSLLSIHNNGNIGIGIQFPIYRLSVKGTYSSPQALISYDGSNGIFFHAQGTSSHTNWLIGQQRTTDGGLELTPSSSLGGATFSSPAMVLKANGNILLGKTTQSNSVYKLDVAGTIRADEVVVNTTGADFVFAPDYNLRTLTELESFINKNKHLPNISPATEMTENGMNVSEMQTKLLQKIEELTLYVIELDKKNEMQSREIEQLKREKASLKKPRQ